MLSALNSTPSFEPLNTKIEFSSPLFKPGKIKEIDETLIVFAPDEDTTAKVIALKAPVVKIRSLLSASKKLVIHADLLVLNGGYITQPKNWDIQAKEVRLKNVDETTQWIATLIQEQGGKCFIESSNFNSQKEVDCNFDIPSAPPLSDRITDIAAELKDFKDKLLNWH